MKKRLFIALSLSLLVLVSMSIGAFAASNLQKIEAYLNKDLKIKINGEFWTPKDQKGNVIYPITYKGTTYLPVRAVGEAVGYKVDYDGNVLLDDVNSVLVGDVYKVDGLIFSDVTVEENDFGWDIAAELKNASGKDINGATFTITFKDKDGKRVGTAIGSVQDLKNGESNTIQFATTDDLDGYETLKFQVDTLF